MYTFKDTNLLFYNMKLLWFTVLLTLDRTSVRVSQGLYYESAQSDVMKKGLTWPLSSIMFPPCNDNIAGSVSPYPIDKGARGTSKSVRPIPL